MNRILLQKPIRSFTKKKFWTTTMAMLLFFMVLSAAKLQAQITVTVTGGTTTTPNLLTSYPSFLAFTTALNGVTGMNGQVFAKLANGSETAPVKGFTIGSLSLNAVVSATNNVFIDGSGATNLNAAVGTATAANVSPDGILTLVGADRIYISNLIFNDNNTTSSTTAMEFGVALFKTSATDGCQFNTIDNCIFNMQRINITNGAGPMGEGQAAIMIINATPTAATTGLIPAATSGASSDNTIIGNLISGGRNGIIMYGYIAPSPYTFVDSRNIISSNGIENFGGGLPAAVCNGIIARGQWDADIQFNYVDNNTGTGVNNTSVLTGILVGNANNSNSAVTNNTVKLQSGTTAGTQLNGIFNAINSGANAPGFTVTMSNNIIDLAQPLATAATLVRGIQCQSSSQNLTINNNTISGLSPFTGSGNIVGINVAGAATITTITNNIVKNFNRTAATGATYGILAVGTALTPTATTGPTNVVATSNTIDNLTFTAASNQGDVYGINTGNFVASTLINLNTIKNLGTGSEGRIWGIRETSNLEETKTCRNNTIFNLIGQTGVSTTNNILITGIDYGGIVGLTMNTEISGNTIYSLRSQATGTATGGVNGISASISQPKSIFNNKIYDLSNNLTVGSVHGIITVVNVSNIYNNTIGDLKTPNLDATTNTNLSGIRCVNFTNANLFYNSIFLNGTSVGTNFSSNAVLAETAGNLLMRNNILINNSVAKGTGLASAFTRADATLTTYNASSNNNLLVGSTIFSDGTNTDANLAAFKTRMVTRDQASVTETTTPFTSTVGSSIDFLRLPTNAVSVANNNALPVTSPAITNDYFGVVRSTTTPDIGASEFAGLVCTAPTVYAVSGGGNGCGSTGVPVGLVNSQTGVNYQLKLNGTATGGLVAGTGAALAYGNQTVAGTYTVDATSNVAGCATPVAMSGSAVVTTSPAVTATTSQTNVSCFGGSNGSATVLAAGGTAPFTYLWSPSGGTNATTTGRTNGNYTCTITDANSCTATRSFTITQPPALSNSSVVMNIACNGLSTGSINITVTGGTAPYTYNWGGGIVTEDRTGLPAGTYSVTITDANSCTLTRSFTLTQPTSPLSGSTVVTNVACNGGSNGAINLTPSGGTAPYTYLWAGGITTEDRTGLIAGTYSVIITDANSCSVTVGGILVAQPTSPLSGSTVVTNVACNGGSNGAINLTPAGGTAPYTYLWAGGITTEDRTGLIAGTYSVIITDANSCSVTVGGILVAQPTSPLSGSTVVINVACNGGSNGAINLTPSGGTAPYTYVWAGGITTEDRIGLIAGTYSVIITDANSCSVTVGGILVAQPTSPLSGSTAVTNVSCNGGSNGAINLTPSGGTAPYTYLWAGGITTEDRTGLAAGMYSVTITDANGCPRTVGGIVVIQPTAISGSTVVTNVACNGGTNGAVNLTPSGGTAPYTYLWSDGVTTEDRTGLAAGTYSVTITDVNGCPRTVGGIVVIEPTFVFGSTVVNNVTCFGGTNGAINLTPTGGTAPYTYLWAGGITTEDRTGLAAGTYSVTITDANSCFNTVGGISVTQPAAVNNSVSQASGVLTATQNGATYQWFQCPSTLISGETNQNFTPTVVGDYKVNVTLSGCTVTSNCVTVTTLNSADFDTANFSYYPNPTTGILNVNYSSDIESIQVSTILGQVVLSKTLNSKEGEVDLQFLPSGTYLVKVTADDKTKIIKIIKR